MKDRLYINRIAPTRRAPQPLELVHAPPCSTRERVDELADVTGWDALPDPEVDTLVDFYVKAR